MRELKTPLHGYGPFLVFVCFPDSDDWHQIAKFDPDQELEARLLAERYRDEFMPRGSQVAVATIIAYDIKE